MLLYKKGVAMPNESFEIRTPTYSLLIGKIEKHDNKIVLSVKNHSKTDEIETKQIIDLIASLSAQII